MEFEIKSVAEYLYMLYVGLAIKQMKSKGVILLFAIKYPVNMMTWFMTILSNSLVRNKL